MIPLYPYTGYTEERARVPTTFPPQHQDTQPGCEASLCPPPISENVLPDFRMPSRGKLAGKTAIITGGDSGIGRAVAYAFAREGANLVIAYLNEEEDAKKTKNHIEQMGRRCVLFSGDLTKEDLAEALIRKALSAFRQIDILVNNHAVQFVKQSLEEITSEQLELTFRTNVFSYFYLTKAALPHLASGSSIINTASSSAYQGNPELLDYSASKGAVISFTRSLSASLISRGIRVNAVAPGPVWTPLIPSSYSAKEVETFGCATAKVPMMRAGQPFEIAPSYVFLASEDSSYMTGQVLHPNGGTIVGG